MESHNLFEEENGKYYFSIDYYSDSQTATDRKYYALCA